MSAPRELNRRQTARGLQPRARTTVSAFSESISAVSQGPVLVIVPCLNEEDYIENVVTRLVADGGSIDQTRSIVHRLSSLNPRIVLLDNPKRIQAAGVNSAVREYGEAA